MTFKHIKFEDSPIMRSLEKVAREKGLVKPEAMQKNASVTKKADTTPSSNLMDNIFKLCAGMRAQGLEAEALEVETNYLNYKRAQTLYETSNETGESLLQSAHPEGSHKMENVEGEEATFEDLLDKHVKIMQVVEKKPHGKLSSAQLIIGAVKTVLAQEVNDDQKNLNDSMATVRRAMAAIQAKTSELTFSIDNYVDTINNLASNPTIDNLKELQKTLDKLHVRLDPSSWLHYTTFGATGLSQETWAVVESLVKTAKAAADKGLEARLHMKENEATRAVNQTSGVAAPSKSDKQVFIDRLNALNRNLALYQSDLPVRIAPAAQKQASDIIKNYKVQVDALLAYLNSASDQEALSKSASVDQLEKWINDFAASWRLA